MNWKRLLAAALAVYMATLAIEFVLNVLFMKNANEELKNLWRPDMGSKMWLM